MGVEPIQIICNLEQTPSFSLDKESVKTSSFQFEAPLFSKNGNVMQPSLYVPKWRYEFDWNKLSPSLTSLNHVLANRDPPFASF